jgi:hypothetical protein
MGNCCVRSADGDGHSLLDETERQLIKKNSTRSSNGVQLQGSKKSRFTLYLFTLAFLQITFFFWWKSILFPAFK